MAPAPKSVGRPLKFGRPAQAVMLTLPEDVLAWLRSIHPDPAWAVASLFEREGRRATRRRRPAPDARLISLPGGVALIVVSPDLFRGIPGVSIVHLADGRGLLALDHGRGIADLELALLDVIERLPPQAPNLARLDNLRKTLQRWRVERSVRFETRSIIVAVRGQAREPIRLLPRLDRARRPVAVKPAARRRIKRSKT